MSHFCLNQYIQFLSLGKINCPDMKAVTLGTTMCGYNSLTTNFTWPYAFWDEGQNCISACKQRMAENEWEEACCQAEKNGAATLCMVRDKVDVVKTGSSKTKAVKCKGILKHF